MTGLGQTCPTVDPMYPNGCPAGFTLEELYYVPNSEAQNVTASTPGAVPQPNPSFTGTGPCFAYACRSASGQSPIGAVQATCSNSAIYTQPEFLALFGAGAAALFLLDGWAKLIGLALIGYGFLGGIGYQVQAQTQVDGSIKCVVTGASGM